MVQYLRKQMASKAGIHMETLRYYEKIHLVEPSARSGNGYRVYTDRTLDRLRFVKSAQNAGFTLQEIRTLLQLAGGDPANEMQAAQLLDQKLLEIGDKITTLIKMQETLEKTRSALGTSDVCPILETFKKNFGE